MEATTPIVEKVEKAEKESKWYVLRVVSGKERKIKEYLDKDIVRNGWTTIVKQVLAMLSPARQMLIYLSRGERSVKNSIPVLQKLRFRKIICSFF